MESGDIVGSGNGRPRVVCDAGPVVVPSNEAMQFASGSRTMHATVVVHRQICRRSDRTPRRSHDGAGMMFPVRMRKEVFQ